MEVTRETALALRGIDKRYGALQANSKVDLTVRRGTVHAVVGENGAGKSTLMKIAYGLVRADAGTIEINGLAVPLGKHRPAEAIGRGVGMVHQHFMLVGPLTVAENLILGHEPRHRSPALAALGVLDLPRAEAAISELARRIGIAVDPKKRVEELSVGEQQRVEILRVLWLGAEVLILDEPTAVLTPGEVKSLFEVLRRLVADGKTVVIVTHKLDEVRALANTITVLRKGAVVAELPGDSAPEDIARAMVGRPVLLDVTKPPPDGPGDVVLAVSGLVIAGRGKRAVVDGVSLEVRAGEVLGIAGVEGNGQTELLEAIAGLRPIQAGTVSLASQDIAKATVAERHRRGVSFVSEDRHGRGLVLEMTIAENLHLGRLDEVSGRLGLNRADMRRRAQAAIADLDIRPADPDAVVSALSGGNQQKVVLARELGRPGLRLLLAAQPTRGVDIGAIELIDERLIAARGRGVAILLVSAELSELRVLADRIAVMHRGRIVAVVPADALADPAELERVGQMMTGAMMTGAHGAAPEHEAGA